MLERGRQILLKDGLLDEEVHRKFHEEQESSQDRIEKLGITFIFYYTVFILICE